MYCIIHVLQSAEPGRLLVFCWVMLHQVVVPFFTNCKIMEFIVITDKYCLAYVTKAKLM